MTSFRLGDVSVYLVATSLILTTLIAACATPALSTPASDVGTTSPQFSVTPTSVAAGAPSLTATITSVLSTTNLLTETASMAAPGSKSESQLLANADTTVNQLYTDWLATTGVTVNELSTEMRVASPSITVTVILEDEIAIGAVKEALAQLDSAVLAEAGTLLAIQLPIGRLDQLAQLPGVLAIQTPSTAPPMSQAPNSVIGLTSPAFNFPAFNSPSFNLATQSGFNSQLQATPLLPQESWTVEMVDAWANSIPIDWSGLKNDKDQKPNLLPLADSAINDDYQRWTSTVQAAGGDVAQSAWSSETTTVTLVMQDEASAIAAKELLPALNVQLLDGYGSWLVVSSPVGQINALTQLQGLLLAQRPIQAPPIDDPFSNEHSTISQEPTDEATVEPANTAEASVVTQGVTRSRVNVWHTAGYRGKTARIAIIDTFDQEYIDDAYAQKEIPTNVLKGPSTTGVDHGIAVAEIIYDMAPQATLSLNSIGSAPDYCIAFANMLENLAKQGNHVISSSTGPTFCTTAGDGSTSPLTQASNRVLNTYNTFYVQAAGNNAHHHYEGAFKGVNLEGESVVHNFSSDEEATVNVLVGGTPSGAMPVEVQAGQVLQFFLRWDGGWPKSAQDYDLYLVYYNGTSWQFMNCTPNPCESTNTQNGTQLPIEQIQLVAPFTGFYGLVIAKYKADGNHFLDLLESHAQPELAHFSASRSLVAASSYRDVFGVAAVDVASLALESYSSRGPTYGPGNTANGGYAQPQLAAYANVNTFIAPGFNGTSSATPHVAGAAAVLKSAAPCLSARQLGDWLKKYATDKGVVGYDFEFGAGVLNFPAVSSRPSCIRSNIFIPRVKR